MVEETLTLELLVVFAAEVVAFAVVGAAWAVPRTAFPLELVPGALAVVGAA